MKLFLNLSWLYLLILLFNSHLDVECNSGKLHWSSSCLFAKQIFYYLFCWLKGRHNLSCLIWGFLLLLLPVAVLQQGSKTSALCPAADLKDGTWHIFLASSLQTVWWHFLVKETFSSSQAVYQACWSQKSQMGKNMATIYSKLVTPSLK